MTLTGVFYFSLAKNIAELLLLQYEVVVLHLSCLGPLYVMDTYQEYEDQHKYIYQYDFFPKLTMIIRVDQDTVSWRFI